MSQTTKTLIIDRLAGEMVVFLNGAVSQRVPIRRARTLKHVTGIFKKLGYTVIDKKGRIKVLSKSQQETINQNHYRALNSIMGGESVRRVTLKALATRGYITSEFDTQITPAGSAFYQAYANQLLEQPTHTKEQPAAEVAPTIAPLITEHSEQPTAESVLREIREIALDAVESICRRCAPEALPHIITVRRADAVLLPEVK